MAQFFGESGRSGTLKQQFHNMVTFSPSQKSHGGCVAQHPNAIKSWHTPALTRMRLGLFSLKMDLGLDSSEEICTLTTATDLRMVIHHWGSLDATTLEY